MMYAQRFGLVIAAVLLASCGGHAGMAPSRQAPVIAPFTGPQQLAAFAWGRNYLNQSVAVAPSASVGNMTVDVVMQMRDEAGLLAYAQQVSDPSSALYRRFLTPEEIGDRFGASPGDYATVASYFQRYHLVVGGWPQREVLTVSGAQADMESAFGTKFGLFQRAGQTFAAPVQAPHFASALPVSAVIHLMGATIAHTDILRGSPADTTGFSPSIIARGFDYSGAYSAGFDGTGISIGVIATGGANPTDVPTFGSVFHSRVASVTITPASPQPASTLNGNTGTGSVDNHASGLATPPPVTRPCTLSGGIESNEPSASCNPEDGEAQLDTEQSASLAPGASVLFYLAFNPNDCASNAFNCPSGRIGVQGLFLSDDEVQQAIADNKADVVTMSFSGGEINFEDGSYLTSTGTGIGPTEFASLVSEGVAVFASSGDTGAESCRNGNGTVLAQPCVGYPASDPSVVAVGGVNAPFDNTGTLQGQITAWADQTTGGGDGFFTNNVGSGGGVSQIFHAPTWQAQNIPGAPAFREVPDVALLADPATGPSLLMNAFGQNFEFSVSGGTSASAPEMAAMWALVLQACKASASCATAGGTHPYRLGNPSPLLYAIYGGHTTGQFTPHLTYGQTFYDVLFGVNEALAPPGSIGGTPGPLIAGCCAAGPGYDMVTGIGVPFAGHLIQAVTGTQAP